MGMVKRLVLIGVFAVIAGLVAGAVWGMRSPYGAKHLKTVDAIAKLENGQGLGLADEEDGDLQFAFNVHTIHWSSGSAHGEGDPPCLTKKGKKVKVEIGYLDLTVPDGTTYHDQALWIRCP